jgi:uncharacterized Fe-S cluster-containing radical SAM superfamily protein
MALPNGLVICYCKDKAVTALINKQHVLVRAHLQSCMEDKDSGHTASAVDLYFMCQVGTLLHLMCRVLPKPT